MKVAIIGSGPSGLMAAWQLAEAGIGVVLFEKNERLAKKILASGGGMCNYTHDEPREVLASHYGDHGIAMKHAFKGLDGYQLMSLLKTIGIDPWIREDGKVFPTSKSASQLVAAFEQKLRHLGVDIRLKSRVRGLVKVSGEGVISENEDRVAGRGNYCGNYYVADRGNYYVQFGDDLEEAFDAVILAVGGASYPSLGTSGDGYRLLEQLGLPIVAPRPALTAVLLETPLDTLAGLSAPNAILTIKKQDQIDQSGNSRGNIQAQGELLITHQGLSGPLILNQSRWISSGDTLLINWLGWSKKEIGQFFEDGIQQFGKRKVLNYWLGLPLSEGLLRHLFALSEVNGETTMATLSKIERERLIGVVLNSQFEQFSLQGFERAMVTAGGLALESLNLKTFEVKGLSGLYVIGELVDIDGDTGGYNIQAAFSMGFAAARGIIKKGC